MSQQKIYFDHWESQRTHRDKLARKVEKIEGLKALLEMWEANPNHDHAYLLKLRRRLRSAENQYEAMQP